MELNDPSDTVGDLPRLASDGSGRYVVSLQKVDAAKAERAREFRRKPSRGEMILWNALRGGRLNGWRFRRQQVIAGFIVDLYCDRLGLVVEVDGPIHAEQADYDHHRDAALRQRELAIVRVPAGQVENDLAGVLRLISEECTRRDLTREDLTPGPSPSERGG